MSKRQLTAIGMVLFAVVVLFTITSFRQEAQTSKPQQDEPTSIQLDVMTEKQRKHSKLYEIPENQKDKIKDRDLITRSKKDKKGIKVIILGNESSVIDGQALPIQAEFLQKNICKTDAIVRGKITTKSSQLTEDRTFVFTDYEVAVGSVLWSRPTLDIQSNTPVTVTSLGGAVEIDNRVIDYVIKSKKRFIIDGEYLIFLSYLPESDSFKIVESEDSFEISGNRVKRFSDTNPPYINPDEDINSFTEFVRSSAAQCSNRENE